MPELPEIVGYIDAIRTRTVGAELERVRIANPFVLRTAEPPLAETFGRTVTHVHRIGKRIAIGLEGDYWCVLHLMIAGRLHWRGAGARLAGKTSLAAFDFAAGSLVLTESGTRRRASLHVLCGADNVRRLDPGGMEVLDCSEAEFAARLRSANHTLKRILTDPRFFSGIGNAYSDEILFEARLSPFLLSQRITDGEVASLFSACQKVLQMWTDRLRAEAAGAFPEHIAASRAQMNVHGRHKLPCRFCGSPIQRIRYVENETNYCATCQTGGRVLADRALSRLLGKDWPRSLDDMDSLIRPPQSQPRP